jgi:hypothetical protein
MQRAVARPLCARCLRWACEPFWVTTSQPSLPSARTSSRPVILGSGGMRPTVVAAGDNLQCRALTSHGGRLRRGKRPIVTNQEPVPLPRLGFTPGPAMDLHGPRAPAAPPSCRAGECRLPTGRAGPGASPLASAHSYAHETGHPIRRVCPDRRRSRVSHGLPDWYLHEEYRTIDGRGVSLVIRIWTAAVMC